jgi:hypothetical protein
VSMWVTSHKTEQWLSRRAQVILTSEQGRTLREISRHSGLSYKELPEMEEASYGGPGGWTQGRTSCRAPVAVEISREFQSALL